MESYIEQNIRSKKKKGINFRIFCISAMVVSGIMAVLFALAMQATGVTLPSLLLLLAALALGVTAYFMRDSQDVEYDLSLVGDELRADKVIGHNRRRALFQIAADAFEFFGPLDNGFLNVAANRQLKIHMLTFPPEEELYYLVFQQDSRKHALVFMPNDEMKMALRRLCAKKSRRG